ncbi:retrovirus-related pol polyprotein from transposon TNT 1-94 [Tanacetum coccineum]
MSQEKEAQNKFYKTRKEKEIEKVIALENKVKVLDDIIYKTGQSVQTMNMPNRNCTTSFVKPEYLKKAQRVNPRLYDIVCYNANLALMTKMPMAVPISTREPKQIVNQSVATPLTKIVASESTNQKPRSITRKQYEHVSKTYKWWYSKITPPRYKWKPKTCTVNVKPDASMPLGNKSRTTNISESITLRGSTLSNTPLSSNSFAASRDNSNHRRLLVLKAHDRKSQASKVYYVKGLNHNLFSVGQFCDADLEVAFRRSTCYIRDLKENDLLTCSRGTDLYFITLQDTSTTNPICLMAKATSSQAWLWPRRLSHLNFNTINLLSKNDNVVGLPKLKFIKDHLCSSCELGKAKRKSFHTKTTPSSKRRLQLLHMDLCGPMRVESINGKKYVLVIVDEYSRYTWTRFLRSKDETPKVLIDFLRLVQRGLHAQNRSLIIPRHEKTPYHIINGQKPSAKFFHIFGSLCYIIRDGENLDRMKEKGDACIFVGYSTQSRACRVFNKRTRVIVETIHVNFDELPQMASDHVSSDPVPTCLTLLDWLFSSMFDELLNGSTAVVSKSSDVHAVDAPDKHQQQHTTQSSTITIVADAPPLNILSTPDTSHQVPTQAPTQAPTVTASENINQANTNKENAQVEDDKFFNVFSTPVQEQGETSSCHVDSSNMHTFYQ